jgi:purine-nucleoside phosphorylase
MTILDNKYYHEESIFKAENLLREAKRQKGLSDCNVPSICLLDPDGDICSYLLRNSEAKLDNCWACYHTKLYKVQLKGIGIGIIPYVVGSSFAVLIAEQLFVSGCETLLSVTSSGIISKVDNQIEYILIVEAVRDEGTSYHYLSPDELSTINDSLLSLLKNNLIPQASNVMVGKSWTTDAPYRETSSAIDNMKAAKVHVVEMEAAALYAFGKVNKKRIVCFAHITNSMAQGGKDFEKGIENGSIASLHLIGLTAAIVKEMNLGSYCSS